MAYQPSQYPPGEQGYIQPPPYPSGGPGYPPQSGYPQQPGYPPQQPGYPPQQPPSYHQAPPVMPMQPGGFPNDIPQGDDFAAADFTDKKTRSQFVKKVYIILTIQLLVTFGIISAFQFSPVLRSWIIANRAVYYVSFGIFFATYIALACCQNVRRKTPFNYIFLAVLTLAFSLMCGTITAYNETESVLISVAITVGICAFVTFLAACTPIDFTKCAFFLAIAGMVFFLFGIAITIVYFISSVDNRTKRLLSVVYAGIGAFLFSMYLAFDTQKVLGNRQLVLAEEEYISGVLELYMDIMNIFLMVLRLVNFANDG